VTEANAGADPAVANTPDEHERPESGVGRVGLVGPICPDRGLGGEAIVGLVGNGGVDGSEPGEEALVGAGWAGMVAVTNAGQG
jgi:hypothetical protein